MTAEPAPEAPSTPVYITMFEGAPITGQHGRLPSIALPMDNSYQRGTHLRLEVEVRVKGVRHEENRAGDVERHHIFALETVIVRSAFQPEDVADSVGGSASAFPPQQPEEVAELGGLEFGRSSDTWGDRPEVDHAAGF